VSSFFLSLLSPPSVATLCPYTTLFRSRRAYQDAVWRRTRRRLWFSPEPTAFSDPPIGCAGKFHGDRDLSRASGTDSFSVLADVRSEEHTSELQSRVDLVCRLLLEKKNR